MSFRFLEVRPPLVPPGSAIGSFAVVRLFCDAKASIYPSLAQDESSFEALHKKEVASIAILAGADAVSGKLGDSTISLGRPPFAATWAGQTAAWRDMTGALTPTRP